MMISIRARLLPALSGAALLALAAVSANAQDYKPWQSPSDQPAANEGYRDGSAYPSGRNGSYANQNDPYAQGNRGYGQNDAYSPNQGGNGGGGDAYPPNRDAYAGGNNAYSPTRQRQDDSYSDPGQPAGNGGGGYGEPYAPPPADGAPYRDGPPPRGGGNYYDQNEIVAAGHGFFGAISQGLAQAVEYAFKSQGRPNGYILGEDAGGAFVFGLRYGEGRLYTKDAGDHKVFWQGPSMGYDAGAEGSKAMVLVYNMHDPSEIYNRFGGVQGAAYLVGGLSVQFQQYGEVTLAIIRSGVGLRLGANVGYLKYTRTPTWNPL
jgi:hypothetical protein